MENKIQLITTVSDLTHPGWLMLKKSLEKFKWDFAVLNSQYTAFGTKMVNAYQFAKQTDCTHLFIVDGYDVIVLATMAEALSKISDHDCCIWNAEKMAWPYEQWGMLYPKVFSEWKYLNGGACFVEVSKFIKLFEASGITHESNDQVNLAKLYLTEREKHNMKLDTGCKCFQSYAFISEDDYEYENGRLLNYKTATTPVIIHGNGQTNMDKVYELI